MTVHIHVYLRQLIFLRRSDWVCCVALPCCLFDLACFFLPSFSSLIKTCTYSTLMVCSFTAESSTPLHIPHLDLRPGCDITVLIIECCGPNKFIAQPYAPYLIQLMGEMRYVYTHIACVCIYMYLIVFIHLAEPVYLCIYLCMLYVL